MVSVITCTMRENFIDNVFENYSRQTLKNKELIIILNKNSMNIDKWVEKGSAYPNVRVYQLHEKATLGDCLNFGVIKSKYDIIAKLDDDDYYGPNYLTSAMRALRQDKGSIVGKSAYYIYFKRKNALVYVQGPENSITDSVAGATLAFKKEIFKDVQFEKVNRAEDYFFIDQAKQFGHTVYALDRNDFVVIRHDTENHTWKVSDEELMGWGKLITNRDEIRSIISNIKIV
ncbi:glycosyltransferase family 2 protein [Bacillus sp. OK048]|uniref:glycosyltransferase n=1 Tax=Bacillus sp. OK048 TaxID=1882761 RepID=UPI00088842DA|nr:glycosyltransferase family A protein [Bacillus sp. OK048]SDM44569.1 Glycosyl transferase family 2 [Bacillus sp. OK048]